MSHIVIDARIINSSTGTYVKNLLEHLQYEDHTNTYTILVPTKDKDYWIPRNKNFTIKTIDIDNYSFREQFSFPSILRQLSPDLVHFCMPQQPILYRGKTVTTFHDLTLLHTWNKDKNWLIFHIKQFIGRGVFYKIAHSSSHIICPSKFTRDELVNFSHISPQKITVTYEAATIAPNKDLKEYPLPFGQFLLYIGQQSDYKNIKRLAAAHQQLLKTYPQLGLVLAGKKNDAVKINERYFKEKGYTNIVFTDFIPDNQRNWLYAHCAAYVFPSLMEGFGLPGLEAMGYGAPVISSNATCLPEIYGDAALYFDPTRVDNIAETISRVLENKTLRQSLIKKGYQQVATYSWEKMSRETLDVYNVVLKQ